jgi:hypothetical protein
MAIHVRATAFFPVGVVACFSGEALADAQLHQAAMLEKTDQISPIRQYGNYPYIR